MNDGSWLALAFLAYVWWVKQGRTGMTAPVAVRTASFGESVRFPTTALTTPFC